MKKILVGIISAVSISLAACNKQVNQAENTKEVTKLKNSAQIELKIGDQKGNMRAQLEASKLLDGIDYKISWYEFPAAAPVAEALNATAIDIGYLGDAPFIFANANGGHARAIAVNRYDPYAVALLVPKDSPIKSIQDIKGKTITANKGSIGQLVTLRAVERAGLKASDVNFKFLPPADGKLAVANGNVDVWAVWDPYTAYAEVIDGFRIIENGRGLYSGFTFLAGTEQALNDQQKRAAIQDFIYRLEESQEWVNKNYQSFGKELAKITGIPEEPATLAFKRKNATWTSITDDVIATSQDTADFYHKHQLLNQKIDVSGLFDREFNTKQAGN
ncbi:sulfonate ABC transporter substrate-binding protein [Acinetobacter sp. SFD]|uniref:ABC transporter substrate-binding protein n=1 Tax=unclassified Acinetobacter TaxID=196816 RepID=UPI0007D04320|nr:MULTISPECIES: ABC transporter substrate-binding protein [unclassified Acinetobacter]ATO21114.1 aliphatic sulfonates ABC transporter substrate-binding protein [Acinetobacter sp. LoGeW2-3]OAL83297.1 sulfonate ABC transporter substrate-binding protein [Acinetobacter sp. SFD]